MKKFVVLFTALAMLSTSGAFAESTSPSTGKGAAAARTNSSAMAWGIGIGTLAVIGTVVGVVVASATSTPSNFSH